MLADPKSATDIVGFIPDTGGLVDARDPVFSGKSGPLALPGPAMPVSKRLAAAVRYETGLRRGCLELKVAVANTGDKGRPFLRSKAQDGAAGVLRVSYGDVAPDDRRLHARTRFAVPAPLPGRRLNVDQRNSFPVSSKQIGSERVAGSRPRPVARPQWDVWSLSWETNASAARAAIRCPEASALRDSCHICSNIFRCRAM